MKLKKNLMSALGHRRHGLFNFKRLNCFQNQNNGKATHSFAPSPVIFKLQQEV